MHKPVFIYSSWRTASTWMWKKFRDCQNAYAFCEVYHEFLLEANLSNINMHSPQSWKSKSNHPESAPYFLEFSPLLKKDGGGVLGLSNVMVFERMLPPHGDSLASDETAYLKGLIGLAHGLEKTPVLTCTRNLGRLSATKIAFPSGVHIATTRNLWHQWMSFCSQHLQGTDGFLYFIQVVLNSAPKDDVVVEYLLGRYSADFSVRSNEVAPSISLFYAFIGLHLYLYARAFSAADLIVDVNRLAHDTDYRDCMQGSIAKLTKLLVDFSDVSLRMEYGPTPVPALDDLRANVEAMFSVIFETPGLKGEIESRREVRRLVEELYAEVSHFNFYTKSLLTYTKRYLDSFSAAKVQLAHLADSLVAKDATLREQAAAIVAKDAALAAKDAALREQADALAAKDAALCEQCGQLNQEINRLRELLYGATASTHLYRAWRVLIKDAHYRRFYSK